MIDGLHQEFGIRNHYRIVRRIHRKDDISLARERAHHLRDLGKYFGEADGAPGNLPGKFRNLGYDPAYPDIDALDLLKHLLAHTTRIGAREFQGLYEKLDIMERIAHVMENGG
ncbi:hypothetical protein [Acidiferrobacter sp.]|uniref:hypothetical protein n=1 Tax=Acidiferrobacter sp. TaxID=1872107 RepID=UPI0026346554|nr:hypothetical protein [Acidiferrobacter sp.]